MQTAKGVPWRALAESSSPYFSAFSAFAPSFACFPL